MEIKLLLGQEEYWTKSFVFPGGELQVQVPDLPEAEYFDGDIQVTARLQSTEDLVRLILLQEILDRFNSGGNRSLLIPYFPYARQDRVMIREESFSLKVVAGVINSLGYDRVVSYDVHSAVTPALVDNLEVIDQVDLIREHAELNELIIDLEPTIVGPDAGSDKKAFGVAQHYELELVVARKVRDVRTGAIVKIELPSDEHIRDCDVLVVDDICDGGRTFIELGKQLRQRGARSVYLYVTHGIFSQGLGVFDGVFDAVYCTDSFESGYVKTPLPGDVPLHQCVI